MHTAPVDKIKVMRCAIYTRKSSEEGLEQDFNSLHAQREACEAYIKSQKHEGWRLLTTAYDDGGFSGGTMARPALQKLLADIESGMIDVIVVYKVDRLSRSLHDFAKMVDVFDRHSVSFVSVTQSFNTTTSMGRLTLNVLLSFAQFEREVTGERIRDKIKASKQKGMWMGGPVPLGYSKDGRTLIIDPNTAPRVHNIFTLYAEVGSVRILHERLQRECIYSAKGNVLSRGQLYWLLSNPIYVGQIRHKGMCHQGQHDEIIDVDLWQRVQTMLKDNRNGVCKTVRRSEAALLTDKLVDADGQRLVPINANKKGIRYRYYISESLKHKTRAEAPDGWRVPGGHLEKIVRQAIISITSDESTLFATMKQSGIESHVIPKLLIALKQVNRDNVDLLDLLLHRVMLQHQVMTITLNLKALLKPTPTSSHTTEASLLITYDVPLCIKRRGVEMRLVLSNTTAPQSHDTTLITAIARAYHWLMLLTSGQVTTIAQIATSYGVDRSYASRILSLAFLAPDIIERILTGNYPTEITVELLTKKLTMPIDWQQQRELLNMA